jgi:hypothetical protein
MVNRVFQLQFSNSLLGTNGRVLLRNVYTDQFRCDVNILIVYLISILEFS